MTKAWFAAPGAVLLDLVRGARSEVVLVAPFVKVGVLDRLLTVLGSDVGLVCITRWHPHEVAAGVSDLEVWPLLRSRPNTALRLCSMLHAKYYRGDADCAVGSANLTAAALGWRAHANLELLVPMSATHAVFRAFEEEVLRASVSVTDETHAIMVDAVAALHAMGGVPPWAADTALTSGHPEPMPPSLATAAPVAPYGSHTSTEEVLTPPVHAWGLPRTWWPTLRHPESLYRAYQGDREWFTTAAWEDARHDLQAFLLPSGLTEGQFTIAIRAQLLLMPLVGLLDEFVSTPRRFGEVRRFIATNWIASASSSESPDAGTVWQTTMRWLLHFAPARYRMSTPNYSELFWRVADRPPPSA